MIPIKQQLTQHGDVVRKFGWGCTLGHIYLDDKFGKRGQGACRKGIFLAEKQFSFGIKLRRWDFAFSAPRFNREPA